MFSDIPNATTHELWPNGEVRAFRRDNGGGNGLYFAPDGTLLTCEKNSRRVTRVGAGGEVAVVCDRFDGKRLNSPNDVIAAPDGTVYFTDPRFGPADDLEQPVKGVYRVDPAGVVTRVIEDMEKPNGLVLAAGGERLYVDDSEWAHVRCFAIAGGQVADEGPVFAEVRGLADGMVEDDRGNLYVACDGIWVFDVHGTYLGTIDVPETPANCTLGGAHGRTLFITARSSVYSIELLRTSAR
jgi:gluconolactonase